MPVTEQTAMAIGAVYACVSLIGGALASLPFHLFKRTDAGRERYDNDLWWLFNESPWGSWTSTAAWQFAVQSIALKGDGFWRIHRASPYTNAIAGLEPIHPDRVVVYRDGTENLYLVQTLEGKLEPVPQADMLHFHGIGFDGFRSITPIRAALRPAAGIALAADEYAGAFFKNGARPDFALKTPGKLDDQQVKTLRETWVARHGGASNAHIPAVLAGGLEVQQLTMTMEDAQLLMTREFQVEDIARIFGVPPHMIGATSKTTSWGTGIEQMSIAFVRYTLGRYIDSITQEINRKIWPRNRTYFGEFSRDALLDGDSKAQAEYFAKALGGPGTQGWMTVDEVRRLKNLSPMKEDWTSKVQRAAQQKPKQNQDNKEGEDDAPDAQAAGK
ncbi:MAG: phage portal protein [Gallionellaceae bacterium]